MKRKTRKIVRHIYKGGGFFEAGIVKNSKHLRNNIYLKFGDNEFDFTIDEAAIIASILTETIANLTIKRRDLLKP